MIGIYKITNPNGKVYIGQSCNIWKRWNVYKSLNCPDQVKIYRSLVKYGVDFHKFEVVEECKRSELSILERKWQDFYEVIGTNGLNCVLTETTDVPKILSEETKQKISVGNKGKKRTELAKELQSIRCKGKFTGVNHWTYGKELKESTKLALLISNLGRKLTPEHREKLSIAGKGRKQSELTKLKLSLTRQGELNPMHNKKHTDITRAKMSKTRKGRKHSPEHSLAISLSRKGKPLSTSKWVLNTETGIFYESIANAAYYHNIKNVSYLGRKLNGKEKNNTNLILLQPITTTDAQTLKKE
jgi:group I intron endonuclease